MMTGVQFEGTIRPGETQRWYTSSWPDAWHVVWNVVPAAPPGAEARIDLKIEIGRAADNTLTYWISIKNVGTAQADFAARYAILNR